MSPPREPRAASGRRTGGNTRGRRNAAQPFVREVEMDRTPVQNIARLVGIVFLLVGIAGFIPA